MKGQRLNHHFEPANGWMNDPNGLCFFKGKYHAFFQHNPHDKKWGTMHWGHAVSDDMIHWEELPIALYPDQPYEDDGGVTTGGCYSGSALVKDDTMFIFYTTVSHTLGQTQSIVTTKDGVTFEKYAGNPVIPTFPVDGSAEFRDPKVIEVDGTYYMVLGSGKDGIGKVLLYKSADLYNWDYSGVLIEGAEFGGVIECPDFFAIGDKYVLMFSQVGLDSHSTKFICGDFDGDKFTPLSGVQTPEIGPHFYAPQTFEAPDGRRIIIGWTHNWWNGPDDETNFCGALTIPREIIVKDGKIYTLPIAEAANLLTDSDELVEVGDKSVRIVTNEGERELKYECDRVEDVKILRDTKTIEVFINGGEASFLYWFTN